MKKLSKMIAMICMAVVFSVSMFSCSDDKKSEPSTDSGFYGTWVNEYTDEDGFSDITTLTFYRDNSGVISENISTRAGLNYEMEFDWSATVTSTGATRLTIVYKSGDRGMIEPFTGSYAQWSSECTVAGSTLTIRTSENTVMIFKKK